MGRRGHTGRVWGRGFAREALRGDPIVYNVSMSLEPFSKELLQESKLCLLFVAHYTSVEAKIRMSNKFCIIRHVASPCVFCLNQTQSSKRHNSICIF